jgi:hypothetical protein
MSCFAKNSPRDDGAGPVSPDQHFKPEFSAISEFKLTVAYLTGNAVDEVCAVVNAMVEKCLVKVTPHRHVHCWRVVFVEKLTIAGTQPDVVGFDKEIANGI